MTENIRRILAGSTPIGNKEDTEQDISRSIEENSPIPSLTSNSTKRRLSFSSEYDPDPEIIFPRQANKRKKMSTTDELKLWFQKELDKLSTKVQVVGLRTEIAANSAKTEENTKELAAVKAQIRGIQEEIDKDRNTFDVRVRRANEVSGKQPTGVNNTWSSVACGSSSSAPRSNSSNHEKKQFLAARKSARFWPIEGKTQDEIIKNIKEFCTGALGCPASEDLGLISAVRAKSAPKGRAYLEVIATFRDNRARDYIFSRGSNLASYKDSSNRPTCGIRLHIPAHLMNNFKILESYGVDLKRKHKHMIRKYIKFDEQVEDLFLSVKHDNDPDWLSFTPADAKREMNAKNIRNVSRSIIHGSPTALNEEETARLGTRRTAFGKRMGGLGSGQAAQASGSGGAAGQEEEEMEHDDEQEQHNVKAWNPPPKQ